MVIENINSENIYNAFLHGASQVVLQTQFLNKINVFPIQDGDTGNNLASMMKMMINESRKKETVKATLESFSNAAIRGARGNSGIIFAQYLNGLSVEMPSQVEIEYNHYALASRRAVQYAYDSIESPVEGTILTVMREWGEALSQDGSILASITDSMVLAARQVQEVLAQTQYQLAELKRAKVVDAGAKGFAIFIQGITDYFKYGDDIKINLASQEEIAATQIEVIHDLHSDMTYRYCTECLLEGEAIDSTSIKKELKSLGDSIVVAGNKRLTRIHLHTNEPQRAFEILHKVV